ncbi:RBBP9/YdeN family alpha/beta hydrolase [Ottowia sp. SB7-C50]|uniref:RBBP9/YdeN family alpha/beta hydrolase n=1 Tax=Ottowia sp. SB7-C50 TaxID=3081231 RepID=UPI002953F657|nr:alpha/beta hydrolase [Ottowia sp. SB7-C50]WOP15025.1 alpha/beta hydrolase [Ottowia sp. SB7-C50]
MHIPEDITFLLVPGLREHVPEHWQTHLQAELPRAVCVKPLKENKLSCAARVEALNDTLAAIEGPVIIVAHSAGVMITVHWAQRYQRPIHGALLAAPADVEEPMPAGYPTLEQLSSHGWAPIPIAPLPFPSILAASRNDPLARFEKARQMAVAWGSRLVDLGEVGHLNPAAGFGPWPGAKPLLQQLI